MGDNILLGVYCEQQNISHYVTELNDRDEQVAGVPRQLQMGIVVQSLTNLSALCILRQLLSIELLMDGTSVLS
jgi:hypothetical protein